MSNLATQMLEESAARMFRTDVKETGVPEALQHFDSKLSETDPELLRKLRIEDAERVVIEAAKAYADKSIDYDSGSVDYELRAAVEALIKTEKE